MENLTSWVYIDLDVLSDNIKIIKDFIGKTKMLAVVKADAYGHGIVPVVLTALESGADYIYDAFVFTRLADPDATLFIITRLIFGNARPWP
ncbi:MAG: alanine racemase [Firmicutes bacterium]|nr:alanine racemase [Bacillota bacterium]